jgi:DNA-binding NarL/FixJ family response regulator
LLKAIREVYQNHYYYTSAAGTPCGQFTAPLLRKSGAYEPPRLTSRETETLQLIAEGYGNKQIAAILGISIKTVEKHRQQLMEKLNLHDIAGLTRYAIAKGMVEANSALPAMA